MNQAKQYKLTSKTLGLFHESISACTLGFLLLLLFTLTPPQDVFGKEYYYTRTREDPQHLRVAEEFKNSYASEIKYESRINGTTYEYYKSSLSMSHDELVFETIDKIFQHRLSPFYIHQYDNEEDKKRSSDPKLVSQEACARDLMYLVDKLPKRTNAREPYTNNDEDHLTPELTAFFDSYARQEAGLLMGNTYWVGAYDQCVNRHIFELSGSTSDKTFHRLHQANDDLTKHRQSSMEDGRYDSGHRAVSFKGRYCVSSLKSPTWDSIIKTKKVEARKYFKSERQFDNYAKLFRLQVGICLPSSCDSNSLGRHADEIKLLTTSMMEQRYADYELIDLYCVPDETSPLRAWSGSALYFLVFMTCWCALLFIATCADMFDFVETLDGVAGKRTSRSRHLQNFVSWFSLRANYRKLMMVGDTEKVQQMKEKSNQSCDREAAKPAGECEEQEKENFTKQGDISNSSSDTSGQEEQIAAPAISAASAAAAVKADEANRRKLAADQLNDKSNEKQEEKIAVNLRFLNAFKVLIMFWIVNGHIMLLMIQTAKNILYSDALLNGLMHFLIGATFGVDLFFTMTGFLTSYLIFNSGHAYKMKPTTWIYLSFHRYWRLAPMYLLSFWFSRSVAQQLGSGPLWDYGTSSMTFRGLCNHESWWYPLTLTSNLHGLFEECMITSWYISCDMQFWLVSPIFIYLLAKKPIHGWVASVATILMSSKVRYDAILGEQSARYDELVQPRADIFMRVSHDLPALYTHPHYRIAAYIVGLLAGHYVYMIKSGKWTSAIYRPPAAAVASTPIVQQNCQTNVTDQHEQQQQQQASVIEGKQATGEKTEKSSPTKGVRRQKLIAYTGLFLFSVMSFISYLLSHYYPYSLLHHAKSVAAVAYSIDHLVMSVGASLIIISMCFGSWSNIVRFLSHPNWTRLSKINYALLLLQCEAIYYQIFRYEQVPVAGTRELINILFNLLVTLYPLALIVTLAFEFPLANMEKLLFRAKK